MSLRVVVAAAISWAATTVLIRASSLARVSATKVLFYQLATSAALMLPLSALVGVAFDLAALLVVAGIVLVNAPARET